MNHLLAQLRPDQTALIQSVITDIELESAENKAQLQWQLEAHVGAGRCPPGTTLALRKLIDELAIPDKDEQSSSVSTREIADRFLASKRSAGMQPRTIGNYRQVLYSFAKQYPILPSQPEEIESFLTGKPSDSTRLCVYRVLSLIYKFAEERFKIPNIMVSLQKPRVKLKEPECLTMSQVKTLLSAIKTDRERALVYLYLGQALRLSEAIRLDIRDIGEDLLRIKGKERDESMSLLSEVRDALLKLAGSRDYDEPVFVGQRGRLGRDMAEENIKILFKRAGLNGVQQSPKILRSTFSSMAVAAGCDFYIVKRLMRHGCGWDVTHLHYVHLSPQDLKKKLERYSPLRLVKQNSDKLLEGQSRQQ